MRFVLFDVVLVVGVGAIMWAIYRDYVRRARQKKWPTAYFSGGPFDKQERKVPSLTSAQVTDGHLYRHTGNGVYLYRGELDDPNNDYIKYELE